MANPARSEEEITTCLMALIAWAGNATATARYLKAEKGISIAAATLTDWKTRYGERYDNLREQYTAQLEGNLANEMRDVARLAIEAQRLAIERATERLKNRKDEDPGRTAANLSRVAQSNVDKLMTLTSRPVTITENRDAMQIYRALAARHPQLFGLTAEPEQDQPAQIEESVE